MSFCNACGKELVDGAAFCTNCGAPVTPVQTQPVDAPAPQAIPVQTAEPVQPAPQQIPVQQYPVQPAQPVYQYSAQPEPVSKVAKILGLISFICGLVSIIFCWFSWIPFVGTIFGSLCISASVAGIVLSVISKKKGTVKKAKIGKVLSIISLIVAIIGCFLSGVLMGFMGATDSFDDFDFDDDYSYSDYDYDYDYDADWLDYTNA